MAHDKILLVDDEERLLDAVRRDLGEEGYAIDTAISGMAGLERLASDGPYAVVVSDMRMPEMDGISFLSKVKEKYPASVRLMLTGNADLHTAIAAVNEGNIFRFLSKPCSSELLMKVLDAALNQYHLQEAERELLEDTFHGGINVMVDILALTNPVAFSRATRIKYLAKELARSLNLKDVWQYEVAALLSQLGCVTIPPHTLEKVYTGQDLTDEEKEMLAENPTIASDLIESIPRLEPVAHMIKNQMQDYTALADTAQQETFHTAFGAAILRIAIDVDTMLSRGLTRAELFAELKKKPNAYHPDLIDELRRIALPELEKQVKKVHIEELHSQMILAEDVETSYGLLLAKKGQAVTPTMRIMFGNHLKQKSIEESILVAIMQPRV